MSISYDHITKLFKSHPALRLLRAESAPLICPFFDKVFIQPNVRFISRSDIVSRLEDMLFHIREIEGEEAYPKNAGAYIDDWSHNDKGWLRKFYPENSDEPYYDLTPATEKALAWIESLTAHSFIGTESRLLTIFELLRQMILGREKDTEARIAELEKKKKELDREIRMVRRGEIKVMDETALRERFMQFSSMARELLSDFRTVEHNFRQLDRNVREKIASWEASKGQLLEQIFGERDAIADSDQGRSFRAFWDFLMSPQSQDELTELLGKVFSMEELSVFHSEKRLRKIHFDWLDAGEQTQRTVASLSGQLRKYLDNKAYLENKRIITILDNIAAAALKAKKNLPTGTFMSVDSLAPDIKLPLERPLYKFTENAAISAIVAQAEDENIDYHSLFDQIYVDKQSLLANINAELSEKSQIALHDLIARYPLEKGLSELVTYISIAGEDNLAVINDEQCVTVEWDTTTGKPPSNGRYTKKKALIPLIIFNRKNYDS
ncbi:MAG: DUF3375 domain-containing protein [Spirochaetes bacterium]|nr:DUF3375 domain-containing protein [Spirochaetota bacterium]